jgi:hypothetical protein
MAVGDGAAIVKAFFDDVKVAGLLLPDGWFGDRPMENQHRLTFVAQRPRRLLIELDDRVLLSFTDHAQIALTTTDHAMARGTSTLVVSGYRQCVLDYVEYGNDAPHSRCFGEGSVCLVAPS